MPGPVPLREAELQRPRKRKGADEREVTNGELRPVTLALDPDPEWHPIAAMIFNAAKTSGQCAFYQDSDWAVLYSLCEDISYYKTPKQWVDSETGELRTQNRSGQMLQSIMSNLASLLLTEGERRRVRLELQAPPEPPPDLRVVAMEDYRGIADG